VTTKLAQIGSHARSSISTTNTAAATAAARDVRRWNSECLKPTGHAPRGGRGHVSVGGGVVVEGSRSPPVTAARGAILRHVGTVAIELLVVVEVIARLSRKRRSDMTTHRHTRMKTSLATVL